MAGVPGVQSLNHNCRRCSCEKEKIQHVIGACTFGANRRNARHHSLKFKISKLLVDKGYYCVDEAYCIDENGSSRFIDILAFDPHSNKAFLIDPKIRYESNGDVDGEVMREKEDIYNSCIADLKHSYRHLGERDFSVLGVWMGARGAISESLINLFDRFGISSSLLPEIAEETLIDTIKMIHYHIYTN